MLEISRSLSAVETEIKKLNKSVNTITRDTKELDKALKLDPGNLGLSEGKVVNLKQQIELTTNKIRLLEEAQRQARLEIAKGTKSEEDYRKLGVEIQKNAAYIRDYKKQIEEINNASINKLKAKLKEGLETVSRAAEKAIKALVKLCTQFAETGAAISDASKKYNVSAEEFQKSSFIYERATGDSGAYASALEAVQKQMSAVAKGSTKARDSFAALGIDAVTVQSMSTAEVLELVTSRLSGIVDEDERLTAANTLLSSAGYGVAEVATLEAAELASLNTELANNGIMSDANVEKAATLQDSIDNLKAKFQSVMIELASSLTPAMEALVVVIDSLLPLIQAAANFISSMPPGLIQFAVIFLTLIAAVSKLSTIVKGFTLIMKLLNIVAAANPFVLIVLAVIALIALIVYLANLLAKVFGKKYKLDADTSAATAEADALALKAGGGNAGATYNYTTYNDNSTVTNNIEAHTDADLDDIAEQFSTRIKIGGGK
jgi:hypothetical protein